MPGLATDGLAGGAYCSEDGYFDRPHAVVEAFAHAAQARGARTRDRRRRVASQPTATAVAHRFVDGRASEPSAWSSRRRRHACAAATAGLDAADRARSAQHLFYSDPLTERHRCGRSSSRPSAHFAAKQLADGRLLASDLAAAGEPERGRAAAGSATSAPSLGDLLPQLPRVSFSTLVSGFYDVTPDPSPSSAPSGPPTASTWPPASAGTASCSPRRSAGASPSASLGHPPDPDLAAFSLARFAGERPPRRARRPSDPVRPPATTTRPPEGAPCAVSRYRRSIALAAVVLAVLVAAVAATAATATHHSATASSTLVVDKSFDLKTSDPQRQFEPTGGIVDHAPLRHAAEVRGRRRRAPEPDVATLVQGVDGRQDVHVHAPQGHHVLRRHAAHLGRRRVLVQPACQPEGQPVVPARGHHDDGEGQVHRRAALDDAEPGDPGARRRTRRSASSTRRSSRRTAAATPRTPTRRDKAESFLNSHSAGSGPYILKSYSTTSQVVLTANPTLLGRRSRSSRTVVLRNVQPRRRSCSTSSAARTRSRSTSRPTRRTALSSSTVNVERDAVARTSSSCSRTEPEGLGDSARTRTSRTRSGTALDYTGLRLARRRRRRSRPPASIPSMFLGALPTLGGGQAEPRQGEGRGRGVGDLEPDDRTSSIPSDITSNGLSFGVLAQKVQSDLGEGRHHGRTSTGSPVATSLEHLPRRAPSSSVSGTGARTIRTRTTTSCSCRARPSACAPAGRPARTTALEALGKKASVDDRTRRCASRSSSRSSKNMNAKRPVLPADPAGPGRRLARRT